ncbi:hypothetical protein QGN29_07455 [Temperatibacter marinus]|uniref:Nif11 domain-containing protein n=1 Tax=Temperatibacter marinus TaxID=1456591 RepID=A0AA52EF55_9PROT|nr:hypothetical protein [Temperatibacter marinus]WND01392.1 hypothetical protein QGN29_07455 [Temperatibacter marinus]
MTDCIETLEGLSEAIKANPALIDEILVDKFDLSSFVEGASQIGFGMSEEDIEDYLVEKFPSTLSGKDTTYYNRNPDTGELRELTADEMEAVAGGTTVIAAVVAVYVFIYAGAVLVVAAVINTGVAVGVGAIAYATVVTTVSGSSSE